MAISIASGIEPAPLLKLLADGHLHSARCLAGKLGTSRVVILAEIERLRGVGVNIESVARRGYFYPGGVELLSESAIRAGVSEALASSLRRIQLQFEVDSTNSRLLAAEPPPAGQADVLLTELQRAGRGRRGRQWLAPFGVSLAVSMAWVFRDAARAAPALTLCVGVAVIRAMLRSGAVGVGLKWPNDVWLQDQKIGGILVEARAAPDGTAHVVIGLGINVLPLAVRPHPTQVAAPTAAVSDACVERPSRNFIAGAIIDELLRMLTDFELGGFAAFREEWLASDVLCDRPAYVVSGDAVIYGIARGIGAQGDLRLEREGKVHEFASGEVSLRLDGNCL